MLVVPDISMQVKRDHLLDPGDIAKHSDAVSRDSRAQDAGEKLEPLWSLAFCTRRVLRPSALRSSSLAMSSR